MSLVVACCHCHRPLDGWPVDRCPYCGRNPHTIEDDEDGDEDGDEDETDSWIALED